MGTHPPAPPTTDGSSPAGTLYRGKKRSVHSWRWLRGLAVMLLMLVAVRIANTYLLYTLFRLEAQAKSPPTDEIHLFRLFGGAAAAEEELLAQPGVGKTMVVMVGYSDFFHPIAYRIANPRPLTLLNLGPLLAMPPVGHSTLVFHPGDILQVRRGTEVSAQYYGTAPAAALFRFRAAMLTRATGNEAAVVSYVQKSPDQLPYLALLPVFYLLLPLLAILVLAMQRGGKIRLAMVYFAAMYMLCDPSRLYLPPLEKIAGLLGMPLAEPMPTLLPLVLAVLLTLPALVALFRKRGQEQKPYGWVTVFFCLLPLVLRF